jgi:large repetitive protein
LDAPTNTNGSPVSGYTVTPFIGFVAQPQVAFNSAATTQTINGLTPGKTYRFKLAAKNANGTGPQSAASNAISPT